MPVLRRVLGLLLFGTTAWLLTVLCTVAGASVTSLIALALAGLVTITLFGRRDEVRFGSSALRYASVFLVVAPTVLAVVVPRSGASTRASGPGWTAFDLQLVPALVADGKTVLVDVTASWCLTCKVNELAALGRPEVEARLTASNVVRMRGLEPARCDHSGLSPWSCALRHSARRRLRAEPAGR